MSRGVRLLADCEGVMPLPVVKFSAPEREGARAPAGKCPRPVQARLLLWSQRKGWELLLEQVLGPSLSTVCLISEEGTEFCITSQVQFLHGLVAQWLQGLIGCLGSESPLIVWRHDSGPRITWLQFWLYGSLESGWPTWS